MTDFSFSGDTARHVNFPLGGIGTGSIGLGADGRLSDWEIFNKPNKGGLNGITHFALRAEQGGEVLDTRILHGPYQGPLAGDHTTSSFGSYGFGVPRERMAGFPSFAKSRLTGPYPIATVDFEDSHFPGAVQLRAFNPFIPMDSKSSSAPIAMFEVTVRNTSDHDIDYTLIGCMGFAFKDRADVEVQQQDGCTQLVGRAGTDRNNVDYGEMALTIEGDDTSHIHNIYRATWFDTLEMHWRDITRPGRLKDRQYGDAECTLPGGRYTVAEHGTLASHFTLPAGAQRTLRVAISWFVPNVQKDWESVLPLLDAPRPVDPVWRNYYATVWTGAAHVAQDAFARWQDLAGPTRDLQQVLRDMTMPHVLREAISAHLSTLKTPTTLRLQDGTFYGWEGCDVGKGSCEGSCTHVWNYQQALGFLFPDLERSMHEADYLHNQLPGSGGMSFRLSLPLGVGISSFRPCVDGQMGNVLKTYRDWKMSGDTEWLRKWWPHAKAALEYAWHPDNYDRWDPDQTGVIQGRQHHTLDMELFGPNSWLTGFYLAALDAAARMADALGDTNSAETYRGIFAKGRKWIDENLFNGAYFVQKVDLDDRGQLDVYQSDDAAISANNLGGTVYDVYWSEEFQELKYQMGEGCSIDQVLGQWHADLYGLSSVFDDAKVRSALLSVYQHNFGPLAEVANPARVFAVGDEKGTLTCAWPKDVRYPVFPTPHTHSVMGGYEYAFATHLMMIGEFDKGLEVFEAARARYRGHNRNPWNEIECGSNYARAMASYAAVPILSGFEFDLTQGAIGFDPKMSEGQRFMSIWSAGSAWGQVTITSGAAKITVLGGHVALKTIRICGTPFDVSAYVEQADNTVMVELSAGNSLDIHDPAIDLARARDVDTHMRR
ncbi:GH116 family glycosyl-hydrolase [Marinovum sp. 2_MG-2023]|uniref:GH116 family glycosyl-hydrolase n=1 Tax=unclassified Marinovum TaxID=2647166 RepID=UPI0026E431BE|nr:MULTISPECIES: GH116 family glycosyl-hydrolase [unclassified Marinovum]MDO6729264.1 GH116 family glycosyl-hydrolase [Marinovum sp. 2_MG-2023]MDO6779109.1 GH116 family glycosyl-hydrolase [Marinovum sp. 1_MG-2023]